LVIVTVGQYAPVGQAVVVPAASDVTPVLSVLEVRVVVDDIVVELVAE
jgi:hypothetical protein